MTGANRPIPNFFGRQPNLFGTKPPDVRLFRFGRLAVDREDKMDRLHFFTPVRIARGQGYPFEEVDSVSEAMVFLRKWPTGRRGPVYQCALNCCSAAMSGTMSAEEARKAFVGFARITRILDDDMALPLGGTPTDNVYALRR
ncbi:DUF982 domain-containing protein [Mesorhizobium sp. WSM4884]|uniref:DUF982 domain-containing protein n=1 Tax=Mesorhizobium sp. WSM4884 TaxID=3038542 RepID=UPI0024169DE1|nr:DUF982 domain-containing protein [Mesorhizobium sp. WSM4884]MDG4881505.1 DUF982 domain-containing protein [Mesorhizobium sp. WSM4884]